MTAQQMKEAADLLKASFPNMGFALIVFDFGDTMREFRYISNAERKDMIGALEGVLNKWKNIDDKNN